MCSVRQKNRRGVRRCPGPQSHTPKRRLIALDYYAGRSLWQQAAGTREEMQLATIGITLDPARTETGVSFHMTLNLDAREQTQEHKQKQKQMLTN